MLFHFVPTRILGGNIRSFYFHDPYCHFHCHVSRATQIKKKEGKMDAFLFRVCLIALFLVFNCNFLNIFFEYYLGVLLLKILIFIFQK